MNMASKTVAQTRSERLRRSKRAARARAYNTHRSRDSKLQQQQAPANDVYSPPVDERARTELDQALRQEEEAVMGAFPVENKMKQKRANISNDSVPKDSREPKPTVTATRDTERPVIVPPPPPPPPPPPSYRYTWEEDLISNIEEMKIMKQLTQGAAVPSPAAKPQPGSPARSKRSLGSRRSNRSTRTLEEVVSLTILQTAAEGADSAHFLVQEQDRGAPFDEPPATTPDILADLLSLSVDGEPEDRLSPQPLLSPAQKPSSPAPAEDMYSLYSMPVEDPDAGWLPAAAGEGAVGPSTTSDDLEEQDDVERAAMRKRALMDDTSDMSGSILRGQSVYSTEPRNQEISQDPSELFDEESASSHSTDEEMFEDPELVEGEGSASSSDESVSHSSDGSRSLELAYSSSARDSHSTDDERVSLSEQARNAMPFLYQSEGASPSGRSRKSIEEDQYPEPAASDVFDGIDENEGSDTSDSSDEEIRSAADRSGAFPSMLATMQEAPGMESSEAETEDEEDEWDLEEQLRFTEEDEKKENLIKASQFENDDDDWTTFDDSPFADAATDTSNHVVAKENDPGDDDSHGAKVTDVSSRTYGSGETAPLQSSEDSFPDSPTSIAEFSQSRLTQPEVKAIGMEEWDSNTMVEI